MKAFREAVTRLKGRHILVTGGAGFIGSNLVEALLELGARVTVLDDLSTGFEKNIEEFASRADFSFIQGDIRDSLADISTIQQQLDYRPLYTFEEGIAAYLAFSKR